MNLPYFKFKGVSSLDEELLITAKTVYKGASRDVTFTSVPGRNGDLITDNKRYKNVKISYDVCALEGVRDIPGIAHRVKGWLLSDVGYFPLYDTYNYDYFRLASYSDEYDLDQELPQLGRSKITFNCKPFMYSVDGQRAVELSQAATLRNPETFSSRPYIKITGEGDITLNVNEKSFIFRDVEDFIEIDSEEMRAYKGTVNQNSKMYTPTFPELTRGNNYISWSGSASSVKIIPRWCCL